MTDARRMKVEVWSDVVCPFCYIGKRQLEAALAQWPERDRVHVAWKSFQLAPDTKTDPARNPVQNLAEKKGWTLEQAWQAVASITERARAVGLSFNYEEAKVANTFDAHRLEQFAASRGKGDDMTERLFAAYFVEGRNVGDHETLTELASGVGLPAADVRRMLGSGQFAAQVRQDLQEAARFGINAVPCFVLDRKYAVSGAQDSSVLLQALRQSLSEWQPSLDPAASQGAGGSACDAAGDCRQGLSTLDE
jgi:predicted DsbA family dithiol-disulfide isomerase